MFKEFIKVIANLFFKNNSLDIKTQVAKGQHIFQAGRDILINSPGDIQAVFDTAVNLINTGEARSAQVLLENLWKLHNDKMPPRQKSNCKRLIGCSFDRQDKPEDAGRCFLEAKDEDPTWEKARAFESLGYLCLGNLSKANGLASEVLKDFSQNAVAWSVWIRTTNNLTLDDILKKVPSHLHNDVEISTTLAIKAIEQKDYLSAEKYLQIALKVAPDNPRIKEKFGCLLINRANINEIFLYQRKPTQEEKVFLENALDYFSASYDRLDKKTNRLSAAYVLRRRASTYKALSRNKETKDDLEQAYRLANDDPEIVFWYSVELAQENIDEAIEHLKKIVNTSERSDVEYVLAQMLKQRNSGTDIKDAINILESKIQDLNKMPNDFRADYFSLYFQMRSYIDAFEQIKQCFDSIVLNVIEIIPKNILWAEVLWFCKDIPSAIKQSKQCHESLSESVGVHDKRRLAILMKNLGLHKEALLIWKTIVSPQYIGEDTYSLLECAERCEDAKFVIEFSKQLRRNGIWNRRVFELELYYHELFNDAEGAIEILQEYLKNPIDISYIPYVRARLSLIGIRIDKYDLIEKDLSKLPKITEVNVHIGRIVVHVLRYGGNFYEALEYAYNLLRLNWDASEAHITMVEVLLPGQPKITLDQPKSVAPGTVVCYKENDTGIIHWHIIEDSNIGTPVQSRDEYSIDHPISQAMLTKNVGESFYLRKDGLQDRTATIQEIYSKYIYRHSECFENFESQFPNSNVVRKFIAIDKAGKLDIGPMQRLAEKDAEYVRQIEELYSTQLFPIYSMALKKNRSIVEAMNYVASSPSLKFKCCIGNDQEEIEAEKWISNSKEIVLDASAIVTLMFTSSYEHILKLPCSFVVSQGTLSVFRQVECLHADPDSMAGSYSVDGFHPISRDDVIRVREDLKKLISFIETSCTIVDGLVVAELEKERRDVLLSILGRDCVESMMLATQADRILWTDDLATAALAQNEFGCYRIWTQFFFNHLLERGLLNNNIVQDVTVLLMQMGYYYTKPTIDTFMVAIEKSNNDIDRAPAFQVFNWFSDPNVKAQGQFYIAAGVIKKAWQNIRIDYISQRITIRILERLAQRTKGYFAIEALKDGIKQIFGLDVTSAKKAGDTIEGWLRGTQGGHIILP